ncbi:MAG: IS5 family transposase [Thermoanaerobaculaceae bacterium]|nr:IS5 family transposase [Thermoanaerobaculaceae bacterium]
MVDARGVPLSICVTAANRHDVTQLELLLDTLVCRPRRRRRMYLLADRGYSGRPALNAVTERGYHPRIRQQGTARRGRPPKHRRWVVEAAHSWFNRFRKLLVRFEQLHDSYLALVHLAAAIIAFRKAAPI